MARLSTILDQIDAGTMLLPEFQRGYVWNRDQVRGLMRSLYHEYPVGALLVWETDGSVAAVRGGSGATIGPQQLLLDGQQRITTLYGVIRGRPPAFFEGDPEAFTQLHFNVETEAFSFLAPVTARRDPLWVDVTAHFISDPATRYDQLIDQPWMRPSLSLYLKRLTQLESILQREFFVDRITGPDRSVDQVVDIFNRVNSGGTKLSKGDLALARICVGWPQARPEMRAALTRWSGRRFDFTADWLLRNVNAVATGRAPFSALESVSAEEFRTALERSTLNVDHFLELIAGRIGLDHDRVISSARFAIPVINRLLHRGGGKFSGGVEADRALYWFIHAGLRGRFAGSTETVLAKDFETADAHGVDGVIASLARTRRGDLRIRPEDLNGVGKGSRAYPLLYLLTRVGQARDLASSRPLADGDGTLRSQEIFPKDALYKAGYGRSEVNAVANLAFVLPSSAASTARRLPEDWLAGCAPEALQSQHIPTDPTLWTVSRYPDFVAARRTLLAAAADDFLTRLHGGHVPWTAGLTPLVVIDETDETDARAVQLRTLIDELVAAGNAVPREAADIADPETGDTLAVAEAFWPEGLQSGQGKPLVLELDPDEADLPRLSELGYEVFTSVDALRGYVQRRSEVASGDRDDAGTGATNDPIEPGASAEIDGGMAGAAGQPDTASESPPNDPVGSGPTASALGEATEEPPRPSAAAPELLSDTGAEVDRPPAEAVATSSRPREAAVDVHGAAPRGELSELSTKLDVRLGQTVDACRDELGYHARPLISQRAQHGGRETVRRMVTTRVASDFFVFLWERQRLDLSAEALALADEFTPLFDADVRAAARARLEEFGYRAA